MECPPATRALLTRRDARGMAGSMAGRPRGSSRVTEPRARRRVQVVVLGDFGRSPRMQFHALSLADQAHFEVDVVAYTGSTPRGEILAHPHIHLRLIPPLRRGLNGYRRRWDWQYACYCSSCSSRCGCWYA